MTDPEYFDTDEERLKEVSAKQTKVRDTLRYYHNRQHVYDDPVDSDLLIRELWEILTDNREEL